MKSFFTIVLVVISQFSFGQNSSISGSVVDDANGGALPGVNVIIRVLKLSTTTDADGKFVFRNVKTGSFDVEFSFIGYDTKIISEVITKDNEITYLNTTISETKNELKEVVITRTKAKAESIKSLLVAQKNSITVSDGISAESIKRTPDKTTSDVLKRVSGVSIQENRFVVIRGLNDRYNAALLNGAPLPSSEPDRKAFSFDIFPANMLDNLVITKTASPDLPGEFAGGVITINTKSVPDKNFQSFTIGTGYNSITTFEKRIDYKGSSTDWLGFDNGARAIAPTIPSSEAFKPLNGTPAAVEIAKTFEYDFGLQNTKFKPNTSFQYSLGHHFDFGEKVFGIMFSVSHNISNNFNNTIRRTWEESPTAASNLIDDFSDNNYSQQVLTGSLANFTMKFNENHSIFFKNILSINSTDLVVDRSGRADVQVPLTTTSNVRWFTSNMIYSGQLNGENYFPKPKIKASWSGFYSNIQRSIPNLRRNLYITPDPNSSDPAQNSPRAFIIAQGGSDDYGGGMFFAENNELISGAKIDISKKFTIAKEISNDAKIGVFHQTRSRDFFTRQMFYNQTQSAGSPFNSSLLLLPDAQIFKQENMGLLPNGQSGFTLYEFTKKQDDYIAGSTLNAAYAMLTNRYKNFTLSWGVRVEDFVQTLYADTENDGIIDLNTRKIDVLPSANLIYSINSKQNLRLSYSHTLNRPEYRELAPFGFYDFTTRFFTQGNPNLKRASVRNFDFRYEFYPSKGQLFTVSYFIKRFTDPIEIIQQALNNTISFDNANSAKLSGVELEFRVVLSSIFKYDNTRIFDDLTLFSNLAVIKSLADVTGKNKANPETLREMQGQSPYVFNSGLQYANKDIGFIFAANINRTGNRSIIASSENDPAIWEKGRTFLDLQFAKSFYKDKLEIKLNVQNILAQNLTFYLNNYKNTAQYGTLETLANGIFTGDFHYEDGFNATDDDILWDTKVGRTFSLSATYNF